MTSFLHCFWRLSGSIGGFQASAIVALQQSAEDYLVQFFEKTNRDAASIGNV